MGQTKSSWALVARTSSQWSPGLWSIVKPCQGITFLNNFLFSLSLNKRWKFHSQAATHQAERKKSCRRGNRQSEQEGDWRCQQDRSGNPLYAWQSCCSHGSPGDRAEGQMPGEGSNAHWGKASCGSSHCLEKAVGYLRHRHCWRTQASARQRPLTCSSYAYTHICIHVHIYQQIYTNTHVCIYKVNQHSAFFNLFIFKYKSWFLCPSYFTGQIQWQEWICMICSTLHSGS